MNLDYGLRLSVGWMRLVIAITCMTWLYLTPTTFLSAQEENANPPLPMQSLIDGDTCAPPCWFGLVVGESTRSDVNSFLTFYSNQLWNELFEVKDERIGIIIDSRLNLRSLYQIGAIDFNWNETAFDGQLALSNIIRVDQDEYVTSIRAIPRSVVSVSETIERLGTPDVIRTGGSLYYYAFWFYYREAHMIIQLTADSTEDCALHNLKERFNVETITYYSPTTYRDGALSNLAVTAFVPPQVWNAWLTDQSDLTCGEAITALLNPPEASN